MKKCKVLILQGIPGSGKTTFAKEFVKGKGDWVRINRDDLRNMRGDYLVNKQESLISEWEDFLLLSSLRKGYNVIMDSTNLNPKTINRIKGIINHLEIIDDVNIELEFKLLDTSLGVCIERDKKREKPVGAGIITSFYNRYIKKDE